MMMIGRIGRGPLLLALLLLAAGLLGAGAAIGVQALAGGGIGDRGKVEGIVRDYVLAHPDLIPEAMNRLHARETAKAIDANRSAILDPFPGAVAGNPKGDVTLVAFMDYACTYCRASLPALRQLMRDDPKLRVVFREFPILSEASVTAARWALAAAEQGKYQPFHDALYANPALSPSSIQAAVQVAGLDQARAAQVAGSEKVENELMRNRQTGQQLNITGTPSWVVGDQVIGGAVSYDQLKDAVAKARAAKGISS